MTADEINRLIAWLYVIGQGETAKRIPELIEIIRRPDFEEILKQRERDR